MKKELQKQFARLGAKLSFAMGYVYITVYSDGCRKKVEEIANSHGYVVGEWGYTGSWVAGLYTA
ncbi:MAG TPA: hypothetical protein GX745_02090 [Clostridiales bacterium]|nr:hypothetical protein [Clostridiales bacterium]